MVKGKRHGLFRESYVSGNTYLRWYDDNEQQGKQIMYEDKVCEGQIFKDGYVDRAYNENHMTTSGKLL